MSNMICFSRMFIFMLVVMMAGFACQTTNHTEAPVVKKSKKVHYQQAKKKHKKVRKRRAQKKPVSAGEDDLSASAYWDRSMWDGEKINWK